MRALVHSEFGDPAAVLAVQEVPVPEPGDGQVRVRTVLAPVHNHNLLTVAGLYGFKPELPATSGTEATGVVDAIGPNVEGLRVGQRVATAGVFGTWAEFFVADAARMLPVPDSLSDEQAAQLGSMPFSAIALLDSLGLSAGDWMLQNAANGAVGRMVAQLATARGVNVVGLVRRTAAIDELAGQGVGGIVATDEDDWPDRVRVLTGGAPLRAGVDSVGGPAAGQVLSLLDVGATLVVFGAMQSPNLELSSGDVIFKQATVRGFWGSPIIAAMTAEHRAALFGELVARLDEGVLTLPVAGIFPFEAIAEVTAANARPGRIGKLLLRP